MDQNKRALIKNLNLFFQTREYKSCIEEIQKYAVFLSKIAKLQEYKSIEIEIDDPKLKAEYNEFKSTIPKSLEFIQEEFVKINFTKENLKEISDCKRLHDMAHKGRLLVGLINNFKIDDFEKTLGERIQELASMNFEHRDEVASDVLGIKLLSSNLNKQTSLFLETIEKDKLQQSQS